MIFSDFADGGVPGTTDYMVGYAAGGAAGSDRRWLIGAFRNVTMAPASGVGLTVSGTMTNGIDLSAGTYTASQLKLALSTNLKNAANDGAAASGGVAVGEVYRNGSILMVRVS